MSKPNVLCVGFVKCGTTTLHNILSQHKEIFLPGIKEPLYYNKTALHSKGFEWYKKRYYPKKVKEKVIMEVNPTISKSTTANNLLKDYGKDTKIIFIIRNPIERVYSHFKMKLLGGKNFDKIEDNLDNSTSTLFNKWLKTYYDAETKEFKECGRTYYIKSTNYYEKIKEYIDVFGKKNIKVIIFEDFIKEPQKTCQEIYKFIGVEDDKTINYNIHSNEGNRLPINKLSIKINNFYYYKIYNKLILNKLPYISRTFCKFIDDFEWFREKILSKKNRKTEKILPEDREILRDYYYNDIKKLSKLLDIDLIKKWKV